MIQVSQNLDALAILVDEIRSIAEELEAEGECDSVILTRLESVAFNLQHFATELEISIKLGDHYA